MKKIPEGWRYGRLDSFLVLQRGFDLTQREAQEGDVPVVSSSGISYYHNVAKVQPPGVVTGRKGKLGDVYFMDVPFWPHDTTLWVKDFRGNEPKFVRLFLQGFNLERFDAATSVPTLNRNNVHKLRVVFPPLEEQERIVEIIDTWAEAIALTEQRIEAARQRKKGLMQRLLTGRVRFPEFVQSQEVQDTRLGTYPKDWAIRHLSDVTEIRFSNVDKKHKSSEQPVLLCNYMDVFNNDYIHNRMEFMKASATEAEIRKFSLKRDDVIITKDSETREEIAEPCVVVEDLENVVCGYHLAILRPKGTIMSGGFLKDVLRSSNVHHQFVRFANGITRFGLTLSAVHSALVPVPPVEEQRKIAAVLQTCDRESELLTQKRDALQRQKKGLMQRLLTGRVRVEV
jgi:type I restriction enzyme S subunit